jgi:hypothetical protein
LKFGYEPKNIHLIWVLTNFEVAKVNNASRDRVVPEDILFDTHRGAAETIPQIIKGFRKIDNLDGDYYVILNNRENTKFHADGKTVSRFEYIRLKKSGEAVSNDKQLIDKFDSWVEENIPK